MEKWGLGGDGGMDWGEDGWGRMDDGKVGGWMGAKWIDGQIGRGWREARMNEQTDGQASQLTAPLFCFPNSL